MSHMPVEQQQHTTGQSVALLRIRVSKSGISSAAFKLQCCGRSIPPQYIWKGTECDCSLHTWVQMVLFILVQIKETEAAVLNELIVERYIWMWKSLDREKWKLDAMQVWKILKLKAKICYVIYSNVLGVQMCILCCFGRSSSKFTSSRVSWLSFLTEPCLFHQFANPVCILALDVSTLAHHCKEQSAGHHWLVEHIELNNPPKEEFMCGRAPSAPLHPVMSKDWLFQLTSIHFSSVHYISTFGLQMSFKIMDKTINVLYHSM